MVTQDYQDWIRRVLIPLSFRSMTDTPGNYVGAGGKAIVANDTETGLEFSNAAPDDHSARHEEGGPDEVTGITGKLDNHAARHENGGGDEISVAGLSGVLADKQDPQNHGSRHKDGGADELDVVELAGALGTANQVPKSDGAAVSWGNVDHSEVTGVGTDNHHVKTGNNEVYGLILSDLIGNRPAAGIAERYFFATDEGILYYDDGAAWNKAAASDHADLTNVTANQHHAQLHAANHKDGGGDELDAAELAGALGSDGQILTSGGAACSWQDPAGGAIPSGTKMLFKQNSAPSGWTFVAEDNDRVILNTSTEADGGATGGTWQLPNVNGHAISESEMPSHNHSISVSIGSATSSIEVYGTVSGGSFSKCTEFRDDGANPAWTSDYTRDTGHSHSASGSVGNTGGDSAHNHSQGNSWRPSYAKVITCSKD